MLSISQMELKTKKLKFLSFIFLVLLLEFLLRLFYNPPALANQSNTSVVDWLQKYVHLNSHGYRDREYTYDKPEKTYRIYTIGDSYTFGWFIDNPYDTYPRILEKGLQKKYIKNIEVINASQWGFNLNEIVSRYEWEGKKYHPDLVLMGLTNFKVDVNNSLYRGRSDIFVPDFIRNSRIYHLVLGRFLAKQADEYNEKNFLSMYDDNSEQLKELKEKIRELNSEVRSSGAQLAILLFPHIKPSDPDKAYSYYPFHEKIAQLAQQENIIVIDPLQSSLLVRNQRELILSPTDEHPTEKMHKVVAGELLKKLVVSDGIAPSPIMSEVKINTSNRSLGTYNSIEKITSTNTLYPWTYLEKKYGESQTLPLDSVENIQSYIFPDKLTVSENKYSGPEMTYHLYPKKNGIITIPKTVHGLEITGFVKFSALNEKGWTVPIQPQKIRENNDTFIIFYTTNEKIKIIKAYLNVAVNIATISKANMVDDIYVIRKVSATLTQRSDTYSIPMIESVAGYSQLDSSQQLKSFANAFPIIKTLLKKLKIVDQQTKLNTQAKKFFVPNSGKIYGFVNGTYEPLAEFTQENGNLKLNFGKTLSKGTHVTFFVKVKENVAEFPLEISLVR